MKRKLVVFLFFFHFFSYACAQKAAGGKVESYIRSTLLKELRLDSAQSLNLVVNKNDVIEFSIVNTLESVMSYSIKSNFASGPDSGLKAQLPLLEQRTFDSLAQLDNSLNKRCKASGNLVAVKTYYPDEAGTWVFFFSPNCNGHVYVSVVQSNLIAYTERGYEFYGDGFAFHFKLDCQGNFEYIFYNRIQYK